MVAVAVSVGADPGSGDHAQGRLVGGDPGGVLSADQVCVALMDGSTVEASTDGGACITGDIDTGHRVQVRATLDDQEINGVIVRIPVTVESNAIAKYEE